MQNTVGLSVEEKRQRGAWGGARSAMSPFYSGIRFGMDVLVPLGPAQWALLPTPRDMAMDDFRTVTAGLLRLTGSA